jgi:anti-anti-sigma factor
MSVVDRFVEDPLVIELAGELDFFKAETLGKALGQAIEWTRRDTTVDLTAVSSVDASVMAMMLRVHRTACDRGCSVTWSGVQPAVARMLEAAGLDRRLVLEATTEGCTT